MIFRGKTNEYLELSSIHCNDCINQTEKLESPLTFLWFEKDSQEITIDNVKHTTKANQIICLTEFHKINIEEVCNAKMLRFNRPFYCVLDHDSEVGCKGILFFGASQLPNFVIPKDQLETFNTIWRMLEIEIADRDELQLDMLQTMLKRFIILCTRVYKADDNYNILDNSKVDIVREFNFLVEQNFRTIHTVAEYAALLNKAPKTLSNLFSKLADKTPLQYIHERKLLEAKRMLGFTDLSIKEIAYDLGFEEIQAFSRFFKKLEGVSPKSFKENHKYK